MKSKKNLLSYLQRAVEDIDRPFITESMVLNIFRCIKGSSDTAHKVYEAQETNYKEYLCQNDLINPGVDGVPNQFITNYLKKIGVTRKSLSLSLESEKRKHGIV